MDKEWLVIVAIVCLFSFLAGWVMGFGKGRYEHRFDPYHRCLERAAVDLKPEKAKECEVFKTIAEEDEKSDV